MFKFVVHFIDDLEFHPYLLFYWNLEMNSSRTLHSLTPGGPCWQSGILLDINAKIKYNNFK